MKNLKKVLALVLVLVLTLMVGVLFHGQWLPLSWLALESTDNQSHQLSKYKCLYVEGYTTCWGGQDEYANCWGGIGTSASMNNSWQKHVGS